MDCIYLADPRPRIVGVRVVDGSIDSRRQNLESDASNLEARRKELLEENERLRSILTEIPHKRIQYKIVRQVQNCSNIRSSNTHDITDARIHPHQ